MITIEQVAEFHELTSCPVLEKPTLIDDSRAALRVSLIESETNELKAAIAAGDLVGIADALTDLQYVLDGAYLEFGMAGIKKPLFDEVHRSNMTKGCTSSSDAYKTIDFLKAGGNKEYGPIECKIGKVGERYIIKAPNGKVMKPLNYSKADLKPIVENA